MISKYRYKNLTWLDLYSPNQDELEHVLESYPNKHLHFIIGDDFLITTRKQESPAIQKFANNFETNVSLERPIQNDNIDSLFFDLVSLFNKHADSHDINNQLKEKMEKLSLLESEYKDQVRKHKRKINFLKGIFGVTCFLFLIFILILWF